MTARLPAGTQMDGATTRALKKLRLYIDGYASPVGTIRATVKTTADTGWLLFNQTVSNAQTLYPALWAAAPVGWQSGSSLLLPNLADRTFEGVGTTAVGGLAGANTSSLGLTNVPAHSHTASAAVTDPAHAHSYGGSGIIRLNPGLSIGSGGTAVDFPTGTNTATTGITVGVTVNNSTGTGAAFSTVPAYLAVVYQIRAF